MILFARTLPLLEVPILDHCSLRTDHKSVIFKKLEKVGEPHFIYDTIFKDGKVYVQNFMVYKDFEGHKPMCNDYVLYDWHKKIISIEIKQNKEEMEEKKQKLDDLVGLYTSAKITYKEFDEKLKTLYADKEKCKEFDLEAAKSGKPVCTRDGRKARIICFDVVKARRPIVALITLNSTGGEEILQYYPDGRNIKASENQSDLMMLPEKKEGWINVYKGGLLDTKSYNTKKEAFDKASPEDYVDTVKINWSE